MKLSIIKQLNYSESLWTTLRREKRTHSTRPYAKVDEVLTLGTNFCHFFDLSLKFDGVTSLEALPSMFESTFCLLLSFSNRRTASMIALLCCPCPYIEKSVVRSNL